MAPVLGKVDSMGWGLGAVTGVRFGGWCITLQSRVVLVGIPDIQDRLQSRIL